MLVSCVLFLLIMALLISSTTGTLSGIHWYNCKMHEVPIYSENYQPCPMAAGNYFVARVLSMGGGFDFPYQRRSGTSSSIKLFATENATKTNQVYLHHMYSELITLLFFIRYCF